METISLAAPDDWHLHLRDNAYMQAVVSDTAQQFERAIIMPNLTPPVVNCEQAEAYRQRIIASLPEPLSRRFNPLMTLYLTDNTSPDEIRKASESPNIYAVKLYPAGATTNSDAGVTDMRHVSRALEAMQKHDLPLLVHGEATGDLYDIFDREKLFIDLTLIDIRKQFPKLRIVFEHITTRDAVEYVEDQKKNMAATITAHHLLINRNAIFRGGLNPHHYCLPVAKREKHRLALLKAATGFSGRFFAGTDSAPHPQSAKESACGCAGIYTAHAAVELYAEAFEQHNDFTNFEDFMSINGAKFYQLPVNSRRVTLQREEWRVPESIPYADQKLVPFYAGRKLQWKMVPNASDNP